MSETASLVAAGAGGSYPGERSPSYWRRIVGVLRQRTFTLACFTVVALYTLIALGGYLGALPDFQERVGGSYAPPEMGFAMLLGTDIFGRSVLYKVLAGTQTAMTIGFLVTAITLPVGVSLGAVAGYYGGRVDTLVVWLYSVIVAVPNILLVIGISYVLEKGLLSICVAMGSVGWVGLCRLIRGEVLKHRDREYVLAVKVLGAGSLHIITRHILPNVIHLAIITASLTFLSAILTEVVLTYIGVGIADGSSWGTMIADATGELVRGVWWPLFGVTVTMFALIYALNVVGDSLRDALDPKLVE